MAVVLQGPNELQLVFGRHTGEDALLAGGAPELRGVEIAELRTGHCFAVLVEQPELATDRGGRGVVVAGDHLDANTRLPARSHGIDRFLPRRVDHADKTEESQVVDIVLANRIRSDRFSLRDREHTQSPVRHAVKLLVHSRGRSAQASARDDLRRALDQDATATTNPRVQRGHVLPLRLEGDRVETPIH